MPWDRETRRAAVAGLRDAAKSGHFVPYVWNEAIETNRDGGTTIFGCGWGHVAWMVAVYLGGTSYAREMLPVGADQTHVNAVLQAAGLTEAEIEYIDPRAAWEYFDLCLGEAYNQREADPETFFEVSKQLAEFFVQVIEVVPESPVPDDLPFLSRAGRRLNLWAGLLPFFEQGTKPETVTA